MISCQACAADLADSAKFCSECGTAVDQSAKAAEFKQVTVLFADVVRSMDIAAALGPERLREVMAELVGQAAGVVRRYAGTVDKFTGDGIMAVFGAPVALEDHAFRACLAALGIQDEAHRLASAVKAADAVELQVRVGLNSGAVIAGEIGSGVSGYTAIGEQVGMAQRMESIAPPGGVMLSGSTARLVQRSTSLGASEVLHIKGSDEPVLARRLLGVTDIPIYRRDPAPLIGRTWEISTAIGLLDEALTGAGCVVQLIGPPGIGKSRLTREIADVAASRAVPVFFSHCESHTSDVQFHALSRLLRSALGVTDLQDRAARLQVRDRFTDADPDDLLLLDDLLWIREPSVALPDIAPDARRRRLTALINSASLTRADAAVYVIEDVHWIDTASESLLAGFLSVIPQTPSLVLITYRPEYRGVLTGVAESQSIVLRPLRGEYANALTSSLLGTDPSVEQLAASVSERASGNPFFAEEIIRDLDERGVLDGQPGAYLLRADVTDVDVPATVQAGIGARIDRLTPTAKSTLHAAAVIGTRFDSELLGVLTENPDTTPLIDAQLIEQVKFTPRTEYAFRHPLIRAVAYESQLKADRAQLHRRVAVAIEDRQPGAADENSALIAEHLEAAGELGTAYEWHMRAGEWLSQRDVNAAQTSWRRACQVADRIPGDEPGAVTMEIAARTALAATTWRTSGAIYSDDDFEELRKLCEMIGDHTSLAIGMSSLSAQHLMAADRREAAKVGAALITLLEATGDPTLSIGLLLSPTIALYEVGNVGEALRIAEKVIALAGEDPTGTEFVFGSPLAMTMALRGISRLNLGLAGWRTDLDRSLALATGVDPSSAGSVFFYSIAFPIALGAVRPNRGILDETAAVLALAEQSGEDFAVDTVHASRGIALVYAGEDEVSLGLDLLAKVNRRARDGLYPPMSSPIIELHLARGLARDGDLDGAISLARRADDALTSSGGVVWYGLATTVLVELLLQRGADGDTSQAQLAIDRLEQASTGSGLVLLELALLYTRALLARSKGDLVVYRDYRDSYRKMAAQLGFEGHLATAEAMP